MWDFKDFVSLGVCKQHTAAHNKYSDTEIKCKKKNWVEDAELLHQVENDRTQLGLKGLASWEIIVEGGARGISS